MEMDRGGSPFFFDLFVAMGQSGVRLSFRLVFRLLMCFQSTTSTTSRLLARRARHNRLSGRTV
jgi:hypothetical protein